VTVRVCRVCGTHRDTVLCPVCEEERARYFAFPPSMEIPEPPRVLPLEAYDPLIVSELDDNRHHLPENRT
jgi:hypothetical protein